MKHIMKITLITVFTAAVFLSLISCTNEGLKEINSKNLKEAMESFLPNASNAYKNILYGGYKADDNSNNIKTYNNCSYAPVKDENFNSIQKIKTETEKYYTDSFIKSQRLYDVFSGEYPIYKEFDNKLYVNIDGGGTGGYTYSIDSAKILKKDNDKIIVTVDCLDHYEVAMTATLTFKKQNDTYKIDDAKYSEK